LIGRRLGADSHDLESPRLCGRLEDQHGAKLCAGLLGKRDLGRAIFR
jgi:hypothetical protein